MTHAKREHRLWSLVSVIIIGMAIGFSDSSYAEVFTRSGPTGAGGGGLEVSDADLLYLKLDASNGPLTGDLTLGANVDIFCGTANNCNIGTTLERFNSIFISDVFAQRINAQGVGDRIRMVESDGTRFSGPIDSDVGAVEFDDVDGVNLSAGVLTLAQGAINFPDTQVASADANTLDDYEEGTFTPTVVFSAGSGTVTYTTQAGQYTKIGNTVFFQLNIETLSIASRTGFVTIEALPFAPSTFSAAAVGFSSGLVISAGQTVGAYISATGIVLQLWDATTGTTSLIDTEWTDDGRVILSGHYRI